MRYLRFVPPDRSSLVEVTARTHQSQFLLRPSSTLKQIVGGVLGRAQARYPVRCHGAVFLGNHYHLLLSVDDAKQLSDFMRYLNTNLALEVNRLLGRKGAVWGGRYRAILVSDEQEAQVGRFRYLLAHSVKEGLVAHARDWPGVHCVREILAGEPIRGLWFDRTQEYAARNRGEDFGRLKYATEETFELSPLPCWAHLPADSYRERVAAMMEEIETETAADLARRGREPLGAAGVLRQDPESRPVKSKKSPAPLYHAATKGVRKAFREAYAIFVAAFREAADRLKAGDRQARFPLGSFPPGLPFVMGEAVGPP
jgi:REP element-mobilizing transposase RayT